MCSHAHVVFDRGNDDGSGLTPLSWTFWQLAMEAAVRRGFGALGVLTRAEVPPPASPDDRISAVFYGLPAGNLNTFHLIGQRMPGTDGDTVVQQMFGESRGTVGAKQSMTSRLHGRLPDSALANERRT